MNIYKLKYKLDTLKLNELFNVISNFVERRLIGINNLEVYKSKYLGYNIIGEGNNRRQVFLLTYFDDDSILQINEIINEYHIFDILEDMFHEDIIIHQNED